MVFGRWGIVVKMGRKGRRGDGMDVDIPVLAFVAFGNIYTHYSPVSFPKPHHCHRQHDSARSTLNAPSS